MENIGSMGANCTHQMKTYGNFDKMKKKYGNPLKP
jgi:hypothetical protein